MANTKTPSAQAQQVNKDATKKYKNRNRKGRKKGSKNKQARKDKGKRKAEEGMKNGELRKTISAWKIKKKHLRKLQKLK